MDTLTGFDPVEVPAFPPGIRLIPHERAAWVRWADAALGWRAVTRGQCDTDLGARREWVEAAAADPIVDFTLFGVVFEPRDRRDARGDLRPHGWHPWIPYGFQAILVRSLEAICAVMPGTDDFALGRGDLVCEKARGMTWSWTICGFLGNRWKYDDGFIGGLMSYNQDAVEKKNDPGSLFAKLEAYLGLNDKVPASLTTRVGDEMIHIPLRSPGWMIPPGYDAREHNQELNLAHPTRTNVIRGFTTTMNTGVGARLSFLAMDEGAKFRQAGRVWNSVAETTDHRAIGSSADLAYGSAFRDLAADAREANERGEIGPRYLRLETDLHPERDEIFAAEVSARHTAGRGAKEAEAREYRIDYDAGSGTKIYGGAETMREQRLVFDPATMKLDFCIDPGIRSICAFHLVAYDRTRHQYNLLLTYENAGLPADFYASLVCATPQPRRFSYGAEEERVLWWFEQYGNHLRHFVGDPAGKQRGGGGATSFYGDFYKATAAFNDGRPGIRIWCSDKDAFKHYEPRQSALRWLLELMKINDAPDTVRTLRALRDMRYAESAQGGDTTRRSSEPVKIDGFDAVTALEFYAVHRRWGPQTLEPTVVGLDGLPLYTPAPIRGESVRVARNGDPIALKRRGLRPPQEFVPFAETLMGATGTGRNAEWTPIGRPRGRRGPDGY